MQNLVFLAAANPAKLVMICVLVLLALLILLLAMMLRTPFKNKNRDSEKLCRRQYDKLHNKIKYALNTLSLVDFDDEILDLYNDFRNVRRITRICGRLQEDLANKRAALKDIKQLSTV